MIVVLVLAVPLTVAVLLGGSRARGADRSLVPLVGGVAVVVGGWSLIALGDGSGIEWRLVAVAVPAVGLVVAARARRVAALPDRWAAPVVLAPGSAAGAARQVRSAPGAVAAALGRVEAREVLRSAWFGIGAGFCVLLLVLFGFVFAGDAGTWEGFFQLAPWFAHPLVGLTVLACHRAVTRDRRDGTDEMLGACPTPPLTRSVGFLLAAPVPMAMLAALYAALGVALAAGDGLIHGPIGLDSVADIAAGVVLGAGGVALGVALGRWARFGLVPVVAIVAVAFGTLSLNGVGGNGWHPVTALSTAPAVAEFAPIFQERPVWWHLLWVSGLTTLVVLIALARDLRSRAMVALGVVTAAVTLAAGVAATRPMPASSAERIAALIAHPEDHQECRSTGGPVRVCAYRSERVLLERVVDRVSPVAAALPAGIGPFTLRQTFDGEHRDLPPEVRRLVSPDQLALAPREVALGFGDLLAHVEVDPGFHIALAALGLPPEPDEHLMPTVVAGQARGVVAIWLATRGLDADDTTRVSTATDPTSSDPFDRGSLSQNDPCAAPAVVWSAQDLAAARAVLGLPATEVAAVVVEGWDRWADPTTGTDELLASLGLPEGGPYDRVEARPGQGC